MKKVLGLALWLCLSPVIIGAASGSQTAAEAPPLLVIKASREPSTDTKIQKRQGFEVRGVIRSGHDDAGGNYFIDNGKHKQYTLGYVWEIDDDVQKQLLKLISSKTKVLARGTLSVWDDGSAAFDESATISIFESR